MGGCSAVNCTNSDRKGFRMFTFPKEADRRKQWIKNCRRKNWKPGPSVQLCNVHFEESQFELHREDGWKKLKWNAVPTIFNFDNPPPSSFPKCKKIIPKGATLLHKKSTNKHFDPDQFEPKVPGKLKPYAVPTIFSHRIYSQNKTGIGKNKTERFSLQSSQSSKCFNQPAVESNNASVESNVGESNMPSQIQNSYVIEEKKYREKNKNGKENISKKLPKKRKAQIIPVILSDVPVLDQMDKDCFFPTEHDYLECNVVRDVNNTFRRKGKQLINEGNIEELGEEDGEIKLEEEQVIKSEVDVYSMYDDVVTQFEDEPDGMFHTNNETLSSEVGLKNDICINMNEICRLCLGKCDTSYSLLRYDDDDQENCDEVARYRQAVLKCIPIEVDIGDDLPKQVCGECFNRLADWYKFCETCFSSDVILKQYVSDFIHPTEVETASVNKEYSERRKTSVNKTGRSSSSILIEDDEVETPQERPVNVELSEREEILPLITSHDNKNMFPKIKRKSTKMISGKNRGRNYNMSARSYGKSKAGDDDCSDVYAEINNKRLKRSSNHSAEIIEMCDINFDSEICNNTNFAKSDITLLKPHSSSCIKSVKYQVLSPPMDGDGLVTELQSVVRPQNFRKHCNETG